jgi:hypothetical protein
MPCIHTLISGKYQLAAFNFIRGWNEMLVGIHASLLVVCHSYTGNFASIPGPGIYKLVSHAAMLISFLLCIYPMLLTCYQSHTIYITTLNTPS